MNVLNISFLKEQLLVPSSTIHLLHQQGHASQIHTPSPVRLEQGQAEQVLWTQLTILPGSVEMLGMLSHLRARHLSPQPSSTWTVTTHLHFPICVKQL